MKGRGGFYWILLLASFSAGVGTMYLVDARFLHPTLSTGGEVQEVGETYTFINPLLFCQDEGLSKLTSATAQEIEHKVSDYIELKKKSGELTDAAVYFRDLNAGPWALVNGELYSVPASLIKVPLAFSIYKHAEKEPSFLAKQVVLTTPEDYNQGRFFTSATVPEQGKSYTIEDLIKYTLVDSDNNAMELLTQQLSLSELEGSFKHLGITSPNVNKQAYTMQVRTYASFFRILFNASYLGEEVSEHLLSLLAQSTFTQGIVAGVPKDTVVAHKFGEARFMDGRDQLHDCGVVYKPQQPYLICIMTQGKDLEVQAGIIANISKIVWDTLN